MAQGKMAQSGKLAQTKFNRLARQKSIGLREGVLREEVSWRSGYSDKSSSDKQQLTLGRLN